MTATREPRRTATAVAGRARSSRDTAIDLVRAVCVAGVVIVHALMVGVTLVSVKPFWLKTLPLKIFLASASPAVISPSEVMAPAAMKPGDPLATDPTLAASAADISLLRIWLARE